MTREFTEFRVCRSNHLFPSLEGELIDTVKTKKQAEILARQLVNKHGEQIDVYYRSNNSGKIYVRRYYPGRGFKK